MYINFVMSSYVFSNIFNDVIKYFKENENLTVIVTKKPIKHADIYYYFRPHLEKKLLPNSIVTVHHDLNENDKNLSLELFLNRYKESTHIVCLNSSQEQVLKENGIYNTTIIPHGYNDIVLKPKKHKPKIKKTTIGFFSNYYPRLVKGEDYLLKLFSQLSPSKFEFILVGNKRKLLGNDLTKLGFKCKTYENVPYYMFNKLYNLIDFLLITSKYEGGPACLPEALATRTPVITTDVGMVNDFKASSNIFILTNNINKDIEIMGKMHEYKSDIFKVDKTKKNSNLIRWEDVIDLYIKLFMSIQRKSNPSFSLKTEWFFYSFKYKLKTLYIKKSLKKFILEQVNTIRIFWVDNEKYN